MPILPGTWCVVFAASWRALADNIQDPGIMSEQYAGNLATFPTEEILNSTRLLDSSARKLIEFFGTP